MTRTLLLATHNKGKLRELSEMLAPLDVKVISAGELGLPEPEESGVTFAENAEIKARAAALSSGMDTLADDSGLAIPALGGLPGVYSARWTGPEKNYTAAFERIQRELGDAAPAAYFACALCFCTADGIAHHFEGRVDGALAFPPRGAAGFGYDPIFIPQGHTRTFAEMSTEEKHSMSHRGRALAAFLEWYAKR